MILTRNQKSRMMEKMAKNRRSVNGVDRLSQLPNELIYYIFSFLDTIYMVQTCMLSKRYQHLWPSLTSFRFSENNYPDYGFFTNFISQVLCRLDGSKIYSFNFRITSSSNPHFLKNVLNYVLSHNTQHLKLMVSPIHYSLLGPIFESKSLETLYSPCVDKLYSFNFPLLTRLYLVNPVFDALSNLVEPFSGCPNLKYLTLYNTYIDLQVLTIVGQKLQKLDISILYSRKDFEIVIQGPKLSSFKYNGKNFVKMLANVPCIKKVHLSCRFDDDRTWEEEIFNVVELLKEFRHTQYLKIGEGIMKHFITGVLFRKQFPPNIKLLEFNSKIVELDLPKYESGMVFHYFNNFNVASDSPIERLFGKNKWKKMYASLV